MSIPNSKTRSKIALNPSRVASASLPAPLLGRLILSNILLVAALDAGKDWLLAADMRLGVFWVLIRVLACAGLGALVWEGMTGELGKRFNSNIEWTILGMASILLFVQQASLLTALYRLSAIKAILFTHFASFWVDALINRDSVRKTTALIAAFTLSFVSDMKFKLSNINAVFPGYVVIVLYGVSTAGLDHTQSVLSPAIGAKAATMSSVLGATIIALPFYMFKSLIYDAPEAPATPLYSLLALPALAYSILYLTPSTKASVSSIAIPAKHFQLSYMTTLIPALILGPLAFSQFPSWIDCITAGLLFYGSQPDSNLTLGGPPRTPASRLAKAYIKTILANPESRKIFYFLMLNLAYMLVQMLYGVWTNSLGLISDAIHMAFDCMAIGMGLFASVMATWPPNERFTYGYGRIETLSGFANGIFLILISIFIIFEAIQRILDPPEMNTSQLLLVSSLGLAVNLFGMFAMGGHHHHGHSHSHDHSHGHSHDSHSHSHGHDHDHDHDHDHKHSPVSPVHAPELRFNGHSHEHDEHGHCHNHDHGHVHDYTSPTVPSLMHNHDHDHHDHDHSHSHSHNHHDHEHKHDHDHDHIHTHNPTHLHSHLPNGNNTINAFEVPASAPATTTRFHTRSVSLQIPPGHGLSPPLSASASMNGHGHTHGGPPRPSRHARTPSMMPNPGHLSPTSPDSLNPGTGFGFGSNNNGNSPPSPLTPSYRFGHDQHFAQHHDHSKGGDGRHVHVPNLHDHSHSHSHGGEHEGHSHNMRGVFLHVLADTLGSVGVIISTLLIQFYGWTGFDPIASLFIAILIAASVIPLVIDSGKVLCLDVADRESTITQALEELSTIEGLASFSSPRFWPKDSSSLIGSIHIQLERSQASVDPSGPHSSVKPVWASVERVVERVDSLLRRRIEGLEELTIQVEGSDSK